MFNLRQPRLRQQIPLDTDLMKLEDDQSHLTAARGWLDLGDYDSATAELDAISAENKMGLEVLTLRWEVMMKAEKWELALLLGETVRRTAAEHPFGWHAAALALHKLGRTQEGYNLIGRFSGQVVSVDLAYTSARLACALGLRPQAAMGLELALRISPDPAKLKRMAQEEPDLQQLWAPDGRLAGRFQRI